MNSRGEGRMGTPSGSVSLGAVIRLVLPLLLTFYSLCFLPSTASIQANITFENPLVDGDILKSLPSGTFALGFFSHNEDGDQLEARAGGKRYVGIWYHNNASSTGVPESPTVAWVANPDNPVLNSTGVLEIGPDGNLRILDRPGGDVLWSSGGPNGNASNRVARLNDTGNLVLKELTGRQALLWQSFDHPFDTLTRGMELGVNVSSKLNISLRSWGGEATYSFVRQRVDGVPQLFIRTATSTGRVGFWSGAHFINRPSSTDPVFLFNYTESPEGFFYSVVAKDRSNPGRLKLDPSGKLYRYVWDRDEQKWKMYWDYPVEPCDQYSQCGTYGMCLPDVTTCSCLPGFDNNRSHVLNIRDGSDRCVRRTPLDCSGKGDGFKEVPRLKLPDAWNSTAWPGTGLEECRQKCLADCSCTAYSQRNVSNRIDCIIWFGDLKDIKQFPLDGHTLYLRLANKDISTGQLTIPPPPPAAQSHTRATARKKLIGAMVVVTVLAGVLAFAFRYYNKDLKDRRKLSTVQPIDLEYSKESPLPSYPIRTITTATADFHPQKKLGEGGFGPVYWGRLPDGEQIAVKRLSKSSKQGPKEFSNELSLIAKLQHKNLVRLLGCCVHGEEKMLIYEFMPNKCLSSFIFDDEKSQSLDWNMRAEIIIGIARGVNYLHHDSRLRIVHRDLKAGNILLDQKMIPKISDFGVAKTLEQEVIKENTEHVVGTFGYMSPEYVKNGVFSMKSDVYSFGVIVLEILAGTKNKVMLNLETSLTLPGYAWQLWKEGDIAKLVDKRVGHRCPTYIFRYIQVALLCVQEEPDDRPEMSEVIVMLRSDSMELSQPKKPGFMTTIISRSMARNSYIRQGSTSLPPITLTDLQAR